MFLHEVSPEALDQIFNSARTFNGWRADPIPDAVIKKLADLMKMGPTSANCCPARLVFVKSDTAKKKLEPLLSEGNRAKTMTAPVVAIIGYDLKFYEKLPKLFPHTDARSWFTGSEATILSTAFRNGTLQGGYFLMAARALGLDCGPMSGFDSVGVDEAFFPGGIVKSNFICALGHGDPTIHLHPRSPRLDFDEFASII